MYIRMYILYIKLLYALYWMCPFNAALSDILSGKFDYVWIHAMKAISVEQEQSVSLLQEYVIVFVLYPTLLL